VENGKIEGIRTAKPLNQFTQNLLWVVKLVISPWMPKLTAITPVVLFGQMGEISLSCLVVWLFFVTPMLLKANVSNQFLHCLIHGSSVRQLDSTGKSKMVDGRRFENHQIAISP